MAIIKALTQAKLNLMLPADGSTLEGKVDNAEAPARSRFEQDFYLYNKVKLAGESFDSVSIKEINDYFVEITVAHSVAKRLFNGFQLDVKTGNYIDRYAVYALNKTNNTFQIEAEYFNEVITFENLEWQIYENALAWFICAMARFTLQELQAGSVLITSSQLGEGSFNSFSVTSTEIFRKQLVTQGMDTLGNRVFQRSC